MCAQLYKQLWFAGHLEEICVHVSCNLHCQSSSKPAFCFSLFLTAEAFYSLSRSLVAAPVLLSCSLFALLLLDTAVWTCFSPVHEWGSPQGRPLYLFSIEFVLLCHPLSIYMQNTSALSQICHYTRVPEQTKPWFFPRPSECGNFCSLQL